MSAFEHVTTLIAHYKYGLLFPIAVIEGPIISVIAGFLSARGYLNIFIAYVILVVGDLVGDTGYYLIGRYGGRRFIRRWGHWIGVKEEQLKGADRFFERHAGKTLLFGKSHAMGSITLMGAGLSWVPYPKFIWYNLLGTLVKTLILILIGYYFGQALSLINHYINYADATFSGLAMLVVVYLLLRKIWKK